MTYDLAVYILLGTYLVGVVVFATALYIVEGRHQRKRRG